MVGSSHLSHSDARILALANSAGATMALLEKPSYLPTSITITYIGSLEQLILQQCSMKTTVDIHQYRILDSLSLYHSVYYELRLGF